ncbi:MAG: SRPBCC family protein [Pseudomonadota bacterium]|nr:SRPBCC family protein [Pseudomonadota bacterium]
MTDSKRQIAGAAAGLGLGLAVGGLVLGLRAHRRRQGSDRAPGYTARHVHGPLDIAGRSVTIRRPRNELYAFWRSFPNLVDVMENVERIVVKDDDAKRSVWTIKAPGGTTVDVETEVVEDTQDERIAWRSVEGSDIETQGEVSFADAPGDRGTRVTLVVAYDPPGGKAGKAIAKLFMREPQVQARHDLKRFKMLMETGEIATSASRKENTRAAEKEKAA